MSDSGKEDLICALHKSVRDLQQGIDTHSCLMASIIAKQADGMGIGPRVENCPARPREFKMKEALKEAIEVIEESRKSFKSK